MSEPVYPDYNATPVRRMEYHVDTSGYFAC
jgi:hypothetical protein